MDKFIKGLKGQINERFESIAMLKEKEKNQIGVLEETRRWIKDSEDALKEMELALSTLELVNNFNVTHLSEAFTDPVIKCIQDVCECECEKVKLSNHFKQLITGIRCDE